jgi:hypothetical protein
MIVVLVFLSEDKLKKKKTTNEAVFAGSNNRLAIN